ncbi:protein O-GlcNAcase-like [Saccostrea cucullata]|uniref:protein O-GlcNAcase-like n=1 Tax=Saccostrea cuccullata TaxID=36930 RepID=UPI002ECFC7C3
MTAGEEILDNRPKRKFVCGAVEGFYGRPWTTEQRKILFEWLKKMKMNTYMYAPKDDCKHRAFWRDLYSVEEAENLTSLIEAAKEHGVEFVYALSPGLDITFSSTKDVQFLKRKLEQVTSFGCTAFALLFDDIEPGLSETDRSAFQSFGAAQVSVTNEVYQHLGQPQFYFCPTEYCSSRAVPNLLSSDYLNTLGAKLLKDIDVLWTGPKVISKKLTVQHLQEVSSVIKRPPVIWDNIHANDYDPRRVFLGPFDGRSPEIIPYLRGLLTNPNCEFEANYVALHTLGQWSVSNSDGLKKDIIADGEHLSPVAADIRLETESDFGSNEDLPSRIDRRYQTRLALKQALDDWMLEINTNRQPPRVVAPLTTTGPPIPIPSIPAPPMDNNVAPVCADNLAASFAGPQDPNPPANLVDSTIPSDSESEVSEDPEPMEYVPTAVPPLCKEPTPSPEDVMQVETEVPSAVEDKDCCMTNPECFMREDLSLLVDFFYTPFDHGMTSVQLLQDLHHLKSHAGVVVRGQGRFNSEEASNWMEAADKFLAVVQRVDRMIRLIQHIPNAAVVHEFFSYLWDLQGLLQLCASYVQWLKLGQIKESAIPRLSEPSPNSPTWCSKGYKELFHSGDQEPWVFRGGVQGEIQRLLPSDGAHDLFLIRPPEVLLKKLYSYRPYLPTDQSSVYNICLKTCDDGMDGTEVFPDFPDLIADRIIGAIVSISPEYCFVVCDELGVCGYALAALDATQLRQKSEISWIPAMYQKYPKPNKEELTPSEEVIMSFHTPQRSTPVSVTQRYPSVIRLDFIPPRVEDYSVPKRLLACAVMALKTSGSTGIHVEMNVGDKCMIDHYQRMGFFPIMDAAGGPDDVVYLGRAI